jgi:uroporphyrinogen-III synthase
VTAADPLEGLRIVVTRAAAPKDALAVRLAALGADVIRAPSIEITDPDSWSDVDDAIARLTRGAYEWIVFASVNAVTRFLERSAGAALGSAKIAAVGPTTADSLRERGIEVDLVPATHTSDALAAAIGPGRGSVLWPRVQDGPRDAVAALERRGRRVDEVAVYRNVPASKDSPGMGRVLAGDFDVMTFASASAVVNLARVAPAHELGLGPSDEPQRIVACIGPSTAAQARRLGFRVDVVASEHSARGLADALIEGREGVRGNR